MYKRLQKEKKRNMTQPHSLRIKETMLVFSKKKSYYTAMKDIFILKAALDFSVH